MDTIDGNMSTKIHMLGIGGIGMSALAQLFHARGDTVSGSDREASPTTELLQKKGIEVLIGEHPDRVSSDVHSIVYSDAVPYENSERAKARGLSIPEQSHFDAVGEVSKNRYTVAVAGSHGKTTTTAMIAKILRDAGHKPTALVGSLVKDFGSNFLEGDDDGPFVVEACEYKDHILKLNPTILVVTNLEWDHTDYFKTFDQLKKTFIQAVKKLPHHGSLVVDLSTDIGRELARHAPCTVIDYSTVTTPALSLLGEFNVCNAQAAKAGVFAYAPDTNEDSIDESLKNFAGSWRRFEYRGTMPHGAFVYDDYAHHPTEIRSTLSAVRKKFPEKKIVVAFHPHLYSRTHDLMDEFTTAFHDADEVIVAPIYPAREEPIEGVTNEVLARNIESGNTKAYSGTFSDIVAFLKERDGDKTLILTMGAGDIYKIVDQLLA